MGLKIPRPYGYAGSSPAVRTITAATVAALFATTGCDRRPDVGPVVVSVVGARPALAEASRDPLTTAERMLSGATAQGLVAFDASGQIEPGIAERWIVIDGGMSYIFRLRAATWPDGSEVTARDVVAILRRQIAPASRNPLKPFLTAIDSIVEMTPQVIEIQLSRPRPDLLKLFAQPELAILRLRPPGGSGPFRAAAQRDAMMLAPVIDPNRAEDEIHPSRPEDRVRLIGERAPRAIARFVAKDSDLVSGGTVVDWPLVAAAEVPPANRRIDPAAGLFGLAVVRRKGLLADVAGRAAIAAAIDRATLTGTIAAEWQPTEQILPEQLDSANAPATPAWSALQPDARRAGAAQRVATWRTANAGQRAPTLAIALPSGPGATQVWGRLAASLIAIGVTPRRVALDDPAADLRLIDAVAPYDSARWYLATACVECSDQAQDALEAARLATTLPARAAAIAAADAALTEDTAFIPIARPFRWSLVALRLRAWQPNARAWHPLNRVRPDTK